MSKKKSILFLLSTSALLVACGGGSSTPTSADSAPATNSSTLVPSPASSPVPANNPNPGNTNTAAADQKLAGYLEMVSNQILYIKTNRVLYLPVPLNQFESDTGIVDMAAGSPVAPVNIDAVSAGCNPVVDGVCGIQPPAAAPAAPIAAFGIRISKFVLPSSSGQQVGNQSVVGRIAIDLTERNDSPGILAHEVPEIMRFVIDKVAISTGQNGEIISVNVQDGAQIHVYGRNAAGVEVRKNIPAPTGTVRLLPMSQVPDNHGDTTSVFLLLDLETGFSQTAQKLTALEKIAGHFSIDVTLSSIQRIVRPAADAAADYPAVTQKDLIGQPITVNDQPPVNGAGIVGNAWIRMYPPL